MNLYINILYYITFLTIYLRLTTSVRNNNLVVEKRGIQEVSPCSVGIQFFSVLNNTSDEDYFVELIPDECCIDSDVTLDCESVEIIGESSGVIEKGTTKRFTLVAPILDPFERKGYCIIHMDSRPIDKRSNLMRNIIKIDFDTGLNMNATKHDSEGTINKCENKDEDPLNDCKPVNCDTYYNGKKPVYDTITKRCIEVPKCKNLNSQVGGVYDPILNRCVNNESINNDDIEYIKSLNNERQTKDIIIVESNYDFDKHVTPNEVRDDFNTNLLYDLNSESETHEVKNAYNCGNILKHLTANKYTLLVLAIVIVVQCCLICTMIYCLTKRSLCYDKKKVERKFFNYRQDMSVTTPLIATSNVDTETTGLDYISESSNNDKKIKCYKACQKERKNHPKISMSDDILSKCLNRRDWKVKPKSDTINIMNSLYDEWNYEKSNVQENTSPKTPIPENAENSKEKQKCEDKKEDYTNRKFKEDYDDSDSSEKLIQCHDYNTVQSRRNVVDNNKIYERNKGPASMSTEKGAQACFSNDSIDDFLSERGIIFLAGENLSKYSITSNSTPTSSLESSKTSKNNILKNILSYLSKKSKTRTTSDPGVKKSKETDLELIHMSRASMYSSSTSDFKNTQGAKLAKDSRSSF